MYRVLPRRRPFYGERRPTEGLTGPGAAIERKRRHTGLHGAFVSPVAAQQRRLHTSQPRIPHVVLLLTRCVHGRQVFGAYGSFDRLQIRLSAPFRRATTYLNGLPSAVPNYPPHLGCSIVSDDAAPRLLQIVFRSGRPRWEARRDGMIGAEEQRQSDRFHIRQPPFVRS